MRKLKSSQPRQVTWKKYYDTIAKNNNKPVSVKYQKLKPELRNKFFKKDIDGNYS